MSHETMRIDRELRDLRKRIEELERVRAETPCPACGWSRNVCAELGRCTTDAEGKVTG